MPRSHAARRLANWFAVLLGLLLAWPLLPYSVRALEGEESGDAEGEFGESEQRQEQSNELREADDSESEKSSVGPLWTIEWALTGEHRVHRISTIDSHASPGHARLERQRGPPILG